MKLLRNEKYRGYAPVHDQLLDPTNQVLGDYKEGFSIGVLGPKDESHRDNPFYSPNIWPDPDVLLGWRETMEKYYQEALRVCKVIASIMALALDLDADYFDTPKILGNHNAVMRLLRYEGNSDPSKGIYASGAHSDYGMMTLLVLATDGVTGLQICKDKDVKPQKWEYIPSIKGYNDSYIFNATLAPMEKNKFVGTLIYCLALLELYGFVSVYRAYIVNIGDLLERWSNCLLK